MIYPGCGIRVLWPLVSGNTGNLETYSERKNPTISLKLAAELPVKYLRGSVGGSASCSLFPAPKKKNGYGYIVIVIPRTGTVSVMMIKSTEKEQVKTVHAALLPQLWVLVS